MTLCSEWRPLCVCLLAILAHRIVVFWGLGIAPDPNNLIGHWQHLPIGALSSNLLASLWGLHTQPPLWNALIGLSAKLCDAQVSCIVATLHAFHLLLTAGMVIANYALIRLVIWPRAPKRWAAAAMAFGFGLSPSVLYYENYTFYPHLTAFLFSLVAVGQALWIVHGRLSALILTSAALVGLAWTWVAFHPAIVAVFLVVVVRLRPGAVRGTWAVAGLALALMLLPSIKNQMQYGFFAPGSWTGLNLAQVAPGGVEGCGFDDFLAHHDLNGQPLGAAFNDPGMIDFSAACQSRAVAAILAQPFAYGLARARQTLSSLSLRPSDYIFDPLNWDRYPDLMPDLESRDASGAQPRGVQGMRVLVLAFNLAVLVFMVWRAWRSPRPVERVFLRAILGFVVVFLLVVHAANGSEQERMRYTLHAVMWVYGWLMVIALIKDLGAKLRGRTRLLPARTP